MPPDALVRFIVSSALLSLRIAPVFAFAPPFSLVPTPLLFRALFGLGLAVCLVGADPQTASFASTALSDIVIAALREAALGVTFVVVFQLAFAALYVAGRTIDIQAGYGLALLIDPSSQAQVPLVGTLFAYAAAGVFFALGGHLELVRLLAASLDAVPLGSWSLPTSLARIEGFLSLSFLSAFGFAGAAVLVLVLADMAIALLSRTVPQMNVLILGFQVKTLVLLAVLPVSFGLAGVLLIRMMAMTLSALPRLI